MEQIKVSVVVTCYNLQEEIGRCLESLLGQTYENMEILVIDDGSRDNSLRIIEAYAQKDSRIRAVHQENRGVSAARNRGIDLAQGEYLLFIDGDDYVSSTYVSHLAEASTGCDIVIGGMCFVYSDGSQTVKPEQSFRCDRQEYTARYYTGSVINRTIYGPVNKLYRTALIQENNVRFLEDIAIREDCIFVMDVLEHCRQLCGIPYSEYYYVQSMPGTSLVSKFHDNEIETNKLLYDKQIAFIGEKNLTPDHIRLFNRSLLNMNLASIRKLYYSPRYSLSAGLAYVKKVVKDPVFCQIRQQLRQVDPKAARKYYRPVWLVHLINDLAVKLRK